MATGSGKPTSSGATVKKSPSVVSTRKRGGSTDAVVEIPDMGDVRVIQVKSANVVKHLGGPTAAAKVLKVSKSQPGRWVRGTEVPSPSSTRRVLDLDYVLSRLEQVFESDTARTWLHSPNAFLGGARPLDVLLLEGPASVIEAIDATMAGSYA